MGFTVGAGRAVFWVRGASSSGFSKVGPTVGVLGAEFGSMGRAFPADSGVGSTEEASLGMPAPAFCGSKQDSDDSTVGSGVGSVDWACGARAQPMHGLRIKAGAIVEYGARAQLFCRWEPGIVQLPQAQHLLTPYRYEQVFLG